MPTCLWVSCACFLFWRLDPPPHPCGQARVRWSYSRVRGRGLRGRAARHAAITSGKMRPLIFTAVVVTTGIFVLHLVGDITHARQIQWLLTAHPPDDDAVMRASLRATMWRAVIHSAGILLQGVVAILVFRGLGANRIREMGQSDAVGEELQKKRAAGEGPFAKRAGRSGNAGRSTASIAAVFTVRFCSGTYETYSPSRRGGSAARRHCGRLPSRRFAGQCAQHGSRHRVAHERLSGPSAKNMERRRARPQKRRPREETGGRH